MEGRRCPLDGTWGSSCRQIAVIWKTLDAGTCALSVAAYPRNRVPGPRWPNLCRPPREALPRLAWNVGTKVWAAMFFTTADQCWSNIVRTLFFQASTPFQPRSAIKSANNSPTVGGRHVGCGPAKVFGKCLCARQQNYPRAELANAEVGCVKKMPIGPVTHCLKLACDFLR